MATSQLAEDLKTMQGIDVSPKVDQKLDNEPVGLVRGTESLWGLRGVPCPK